MGVYLIIVVALGSKLQEMRLSFDEIIVVVSWAKHVKVLFKVIVLRLNLRISACSNYG